MKSNENNFEEPYKMSFVQMIFRSRRVFFISFIFFSGLFWLAAEMPKKYFQANTVILLPQQAAGGPLGGSYGGALTQLGTLSGLGGKSNDEVYVAITKTRNFLGAVVDRLNLVDRYGALSREDAMSILKSRIMVTSDKRSGTLEFLVEDESSQISSDIANVCFEELARVASGISITEAQARYAYFEKQFKQASVTLGVAERNLIKSQMERGVLAPDSEVEKALKQGANIEAEIVKAEVDLNSMDRFMTSDNPNRKQQLARLQALMQKSLTGDKSRFINKMQQDGLETTSLFRHFKAASFAYEQVYKGLEVARLDVAKEGAGLQQLDKAVPPSHPAKPNKNNIRIAGLIMAVFLSVGLSYAWSRGRFGYGLVVI